MSALRPYISLSMIDSIILSMRSVLSLFEQTVAVRISILSNQGQGNHNSLVEIRNNNHNNTVQPEEILDPSQHHLIDVLSFLGHLVIMSILNPSRIKNHAFSVSQFSRC